MMTNETDKAVGRDAGSGAESRQDRLKSALRENLKRRKLQARERGKLTDAAQEDQGSTQGIVGKSGR